MNLRKMDSNALWLICTIEQISAGINTKRNDVPHDATASHIERKVIDELGE